RTLRLCQLSRLLGLPTLPEALARASPCVRSHELSCQAKKEGGSGSARRITDQDKDLKLAAYLSQHEAAEVVVLANVLDILSRSFFGLEVQMCTYNHRNCKCIRRRRNT
ncbi:hypothetical protein Gotri_009373, partial [Gossypium trilobum]|nr:hypothetical protein [Gossypium trilobum]